MLKYDFNFDKFFSVLSFFLLSLACPSFLIIIPREGLRWKIFNDQIAEVYASLLTAKKIIERTFIVVIIIKDDEDFILIV